MIKYYATGEKSEEQFYLILVTNEQNSCAETKRSSMYIVECNKFRV